MNELSMVANGVDGGQMKRAIPITTLFLDIGGVLLTNGWDHHARKRAATNFTLDGFVDAFISSCFLHLRKPDAALLRLTLDIAQAPARQVVYIENTPMFVQIAEGLGVRSILHTDYRSTCAKLASLGFV
jgi:FMN phosphatase YigB (HAD superfamily)